MTDQQPARQPPKGYQIRIRGHLGAAVLRAFPALHAKTQGHDTLLRGIADQAALHGVLARIEQLGLELLEVRRTDRELPAAGSPAALLDSGPAVRVIGGARVAGGVGLRGLLGRQGAARRAQVVVELRTGGRRSPSGSGRCRAARVRLDTAAGAFAEPRGAGRLDVPLVLSGEPAAAQR